ncbi:MAG TPA: helix-turn-helix transcriptional regulator [Ktedonobacteraceae bacterium]|nr:helix-turn-helix transcriptional regulator [Ktedonobacteraceae bacterium]
MSRKFRIKEILEEKQISLGALSRGANLTTNTVRNLVRNKEGYVPSSETLLRVAEFLNVTLDELYQKDYER